MKFEIPDQIVDDAFLFVDKYVAVRKDGTPILLVSPERFETLLRQLLESQGRDDEV